MEQPPSDAQRGDEPGSAESVGESLRAAVERTLAATAGSATGTRQRAQGLLDEVVRGGQVARQEVTRRGEGATARLAEALGELRAADDEDRGAILERLTRLEQRLARVEARLALANAQLDPEGSVDDPLRQRDPGT